MVARICAGELVGCFALTNMDGSDPVGWKPRQTRRRHATFERSKAGLAMSVADARLVGEG
jgi:hypothetical protein